MKILQLLFTGLGTNPVGPSNSSQSDTLSDCGMLGNAEHIRDVIAPRDEHLILAHSWDEQQPDDECRENVQKIIAFGPDATIIQAHSFGNSFGLYWMQWLSLWYPQIRISLYVGYDPCRNPFRFPFNPVGTDGKWRPLSWATGPAVEHYLVHYQRSGRPLCVVGTPFDGVNGVNVDVSDWTGPRLGHVDDPFGGFKCMITDSRVQANVYSAASLALLG